MGDWLLAYQIGVGVLVAGYLFRLVLFVILTPRNAMEWLTLLDATAFLGVFATLGYWLVHINTGGVRPNVHPPLVVAFWIAAIANVGFTAAAWHDWMSRREALDEKGIG